MNSPTTGQLKARMDVLPPAQRRLWPELRPAAALGFALYGGTAIALRLGHRASVDFGFFTEKPLDRQRLQTSFVFMAESVVLQDFRDTLSIAVDYADAEHDQVRLSFFGATDFGRVGWPEPTEDGVLQVASLADLMATKLKVMLQRVEAKDYRDIAAMIAAGAVLSEGLAAARALYGNTFQPSESLKALVYFEGGNLDTLTREERATLVDAVAAVRLLPHTVIAARQLTVEQ